VLILHLRNKLFLYPIEEVVGLVQFRESNLSVIGLLQLDACLLKELSHRTLMRLLIGLKMALRKRPDARSPAADGKDPLLRADEHGSIDALLSGDVALPCVPGPRSGRGIRDFILEHDSV
jgi:hypothetical protein